MGVELTDVLPMTQSIYKLFMYFLAAPLIFILITSSLGVSQSSSNIIQLLTNININQETVKINDKNMEIFSISATDFSSSTTRYRIRENNKEVSNQRLFKLLQTNSNNFHKFFTEIFTKFEKKNSNGLFFESHPITKSSLNNPYEFVLIGTTAFDHGGLDNYSFAGKFNDPKNENKLTTTFYNLGGDSMLVVPKPKNWGSKKETTPREYMLIKSFLEYAEKQEDILYDFWSTVGFSLEQELT